MTAQNERNQLPVGEPPRTNAPRTMPLLLAIAWTFVGVPLAWGVTQTAMKSLDLFRAPAEQTGAGATSQPAPTMPHAPPQPAPPESPAK